MKKFDVCEQPKFLVVVASVLVVGSAVAGFLVQKELHSLHAHVVGGAQGLRVSHFEHAVEESASPAKSASAHEPQVRDVDAPVPPRALPVAILMYHHVGPLPSAPDVIRRDLTVSEHDFERQVQWLSEHGYTSVTLEDVYKASQHELVLPAKAVVFTFDDGYADVFQYAVPILLAHHMRGSFAVVPGFLGQPDYATWDMVVDAKKQGMEIVSHTENHFDGSSPKFDAAFIRQNLQQSVQELESHVGPIPKVLVYPYGHYTPEYIQVAREVGFTMALTTHFGRYADPNNLMLTPRVRVHGVETMEKFEESITGVKSH